MPDPEYNLQITSYPTDNRIEVVAKRVETDEVVLEVEWTEGLNELKDIEVTGPASDELNDEQRVHLAEALYYCNIDQTRGVVAEHLMTVFMD